MKTQFLLLLAFACAFSMASKAAIIYVDKDATGSNSGTSWNNAFVDLQDALSSAISGDQIWVAEGIYKPTTTTNRNSTFSVGSGVSLYGGFIGNEANRAMRNWKENKTILSGAIGNLNDLTDNSYRVVTITGMDAFVDGFEIRYAYRALDDIFSSAGGVYLEAETSLIIRHCDIRLCTNMSNSAVRLRENSILSMDNCLVRQNVNDQGGIVSIAGGSQAFIKNSTFTQNDFVQSYGAVISGTTTAQAEVLNCIIWDNNGHDSFGSLPVTTDRVILDNYNWTPTDVISDTLMQNPLFVDPDGGDFNLLPNSPAIDFGLNAYSTLNLDLAHESRIWNGTADVGCYEYYSTNVIYVDEDATGANNGTSWQDAYVDLQSALLLFEPGEEIWVAEGTYYPTSTTDRTAKFIIPESCAMYGGFNGDEILKSQRDIYSNTTTLSGNIGGVSNTDNSYRVLYIAGAEEVFIDQFTIEGGYADGTGQNANGAAMYVSGAIVNLSNCIITDHYATFAAGCFFSSGSYINIDNCVFYNISAGATAVILAQTGSILTISNTGIDNNTSNGSGGGISVGGQFSFTNVHFSGNTSVNTGAALAFTAGAVGTVVDCDFSNNSCTSSGGIVAGVGADVQLYNSVFRDNLTNFLSGALDLFSGNYRVENCLFHHNTAATAAALRLTPQTTADIVNCTFTENTTTSGSSSTINLDGIAGSFSNCIVWNNIEANSLSVGALNSNPSYSIIQGGSAGTNIFDLDPNFLNPNSENYRISSNSPAYNSGWDAASTYPLDFDGNQRIMLSTVDMGCYEAQTCQAPHDECADFIELQIGDEPLFGSNECAATNNGPISSCTVSTGQTVWYGFEAPPSGSVQVITSEVTMLTPIFNMRITAFTGNCASLSEFDCIDEFDDETPETLDLYNLTPGSYYRIRIDGVGMQEASFLIQIIEGILTTCPGDFNGDSTRNSGDLLILLSEMGCLSGCTTDMNNSGGVDTADLLEFLAVFGTNCDVLTN